MDQQAEQPARRTSGDLNKSVYSALKEMILSGKLRPGLRLVHQDLADILNVSRTPVRKSLERLYQEGYAGRRSRRGYFVAEVETLEGMNTEYAQMFPATVNRARLMVDQNLQRTLASFCGNEHLCKTLVAVFEKIELKKRRLDGYGLVVGDAPLQDHLTLVEAIMLAPRTSRAITSVRPPRVYWTTWRRTPFPPPSSEAFAQPSPRTSAALPLAACNSSATSAWVVTKRTPSST